MNKKELLSIDQKYLWHPFTPHSVYPNEKPLVVKEADGHYLIDADGKKYFDAVGSIWCNILGHRHPRINEAISEQLNKVAHATLLGNSSEKPVLLAKRLVELAPEGIDKAFYSDNGSTSVEIALKMAYQYFQQHESGKFKKKRHFLTFENSYHGDTMGAVSVGGVEIFFETFKDLGFKSLKAPSPYFYRNDLSLDQFYQKTEALIRQNSDELVAVIIESGMQGAGGMIPFPKGFSKWLRNLTEELGILLIFDEVAMGMGRSGKFFACEREEVLPDFICIAKGITGGYLPLAVTLTRDKIYQGFLGRPEQARTFFHGHTYTGNALGAAAALAVLDIFESEKFYEDLNIKIAELSTGLSELSENKFVGDVRQYGLAAGIELVRDKKSKEAFHSKDRVAMKVCAKIQEKGIFMRPLGDVLILMPPLSINKEEMSHLLKSIDWAIEESIKL